jgi:hypothetical protein
MINVAALLDRWTARVCRPFNEKRKMKEREVSRQYNMDRSICKNSLIAQNLSTDDLLDAAGNLFAGYCRLEKQLKQKIDNQRVIIVLLLFVMAVLLRDLVQWNKL